MIRGDESYSTKADVYSFGMCCYEILCDGQPPFRDLAQLQLVRAIEEGRRPTLYGVFFLKKNTILGKAEPRSSNESLSFCRPANTDPDFAEVLALCWHEEADRRPSFQQLATLLSEQEQQYASAATAAVPKQR